MNNKIRNNFVTAVTLSYVGLWLGWIIISIVSLMDTSGNYDSFTRHGLIHGTRFLRRLLSSVVIETSYWPTTSSPDCL